MIIDRLTDGIKFIMEIRKYYYVLRKKKDNHLYNNVSNLYYNNIL